MARPIAIVFFLMLAGQSSAQGLESFTNGPVFEEFGPHAVIDGIKFPADTKLAVAFDVSKAAAEGQTSRQLETVARFLNMHAAAGIPLEHLSAAIVVHGGASFDLVIDEARDMPNPNVALIAALLEAGVSIQLCGQSAAYQGIEPEDLLPGITMSLSAMTAHALLQQRGYTLNPF